MKLKSVRKVGSALLCCCFLLLILIQAPLPASAAGKYMEGRSADFFIMLDESGGVFVTETWNCFFGGDTITRYRRHYTVPDSDLCELEVYDISMDGEPMEILDEPDDSRPEGSAAVYQEGDTVHMEMYLDALNEEHSFEISYYMTNAVVLYNDVAEFHWNLSSENEAFDIDEITGYIEIPYGTEDKGLYFWGHGPEENAYFDANVEDGMVNTFSLYTENVSKDQSVNVRFAMPPQLFPDCTRIVADDALDAILEEEHTLAGEPGGNSGVSSMVPDDPDDPIVTPDPESSKLDDFMYNLSVFWSVFMGIWSIFSVAFCVLPILVMLLLDPLFTWYANNRYLPKQLAAHRRKPVQAPTYYRGLPDDLKPAMVYKLMTIYPVKGEGKEILKKGNAFSATILDLAESGLLRLDRNQNNEVTYFVTPKAAEADLTRYERNIIELYTAAGADKEAMSTAQITTYMRDNYSWCKVHYNDFDILVKEEFSETNLYTEIKKKGEPAAQSKEKVGKAGKIQYTSLNAKKIPLAVLFGILIFFGTSHLLGFVGGLILSVVMGFMNTLVFSSIYDYMHPDYNLLTQEGENRYAMWKAYARFLEEFTTFDEREVADVKVWRKYLVYAVALGCSEKVMENLKIALPEVYESFISDPYLPSYDDIFTSVSSIDAEGGYTIRSSSSDSSDSSSGGDDGWGGFSDSGGDSDSGSSGSDFD